MGFVSSTVGKRLYLTSHALHYYCKCKINITFWTSRVQDKEQKNVALNSNYFIYFSFTYKSQIVLVLNKNAIAGCSSPCYFFICISGWLITQQNKQQSYCGRLSWKGGDVGSCYLSRSPGSTYLPQYTALDTFRAGSKTCASKH